MQNFTLIPNPKAKLKKKHSTKKLFTKNCPFASFFKINLYLCTFFEFRLKTWNENKILRILVPILTYFNTKYFFLNTGQIFSPSNRSIWVPKNAEFYAYSKSEDEIEKKFFDNNFFVMRFISVLPSELESV